MIAGRQILRVIALCAGVLSVLATPSTAQSTGGAPAPLSDADITRILAERIDAQQQSVGIVVGVLEPGGRRVISYGHPAKGDPRRVDGDTVFEIGSITKVFTALLLSDAVERGEVSLSDPVSRYLPASVKVPQRGRAITLGDLASHVSGLPRLPTNMASTNPRNPYADYTVDQLYAFLSGYELPRDAGAQYQYSNLGGGLLGHVLALRAGMSYEALVESRITRPLGMTSTRITLSDDMRGRLASGYDATLQPASNWDLPTLAGAGALRSTVNDLLLFLSAAMGERPTPLAKAFAAMTTARRPAGAAPALEIALGWHVWTANGHDVVWHNGGTAGYRTFIGFDPRAHTAVVALSNAGTPAGVDDIGRHLLDRQIPLRAQPKARTAITVNAAILDGYVGRYQLAPSAFLTVSRKESGLFAQLTGQMEFEIFAESPREFFYKVVDAQLTFEVGADGRATAVVLHQAGRDIRGARVVP